MDLTGAYKPRRLTRKSCMWRWVRPGWLRIGQYHIHRLGVGCVFLDLAWTGLVNMGWVISWLNEREICPQETNRSGLGMGVTGRICLHWRGIICKIHFMLGIPHASQKGGRGDVSPPKFELGRTQYTLSPQKIINIMVKYHTPMKTEQGKLNCYPLKTVSEVFFEPLKRIYISLEEHNIGIL